ncbi:MAG: LCP family protein [Candidatus Kapabacteria bacterium]|nr:LCP family protein [Candidatus Kapabacteria bacterium]
MVRVRLILKIALIAIIQLINIGCSKNDEPAEIKKGRRKGEKEISVQVDSTTIKAMEKLPVFHGRTITVSICGVDSRLNDNIHHADANHVLRCWLDEGAIEIIDIPRDTYADAGLGGDLNNLANLRANRGRDAYLKKIASVIGAKNIDYYVELGFSQAQGLLELVGQKDDAATTLRVLRSRQGFDAGDYQRVYNQGIFMRKILLNHFGKATGWFRDPMLRAAIVLTETNIPLDTMKMIIDVLEEKGFPGNNQCYVHIMPKYNYKLAAYDFTDKSVLQKMNERIDQRLRWDGVEVGKLKAGDYEQRLGELIAKAEQQKHPKNAISLLQRAYTQRAWMQITNTSLRADYAKRICLLLITCYTKIDKKDEALKVLSFYEEQKDVLDGGLF